MAGVVKLFEKRFSTFAPVLLNCNSRINLHPSGTCCGKLKIDF